MSTSLIESSYGKSQVRLTKVTRKGAHHDLKELCVSIQLQGQFDRSYTEGDNSQVIATDTMKNTVYALAARYPIDDIESFGKRLAEHFITGNAHVSAASVEIAQQWWQRITRGGKPHDHAFISGSNEKRVAHVDMVRGTIVVEAGIEGMQVLKTADSEFSGFLRDQYTTLADTKDRIFATNISAYWYYSQDKLDFNGMFERIRQTILDVFAEHHSLAVQQTIYQIGKRVLDDFADVEEIRISMPNQHRLPVDLTRLGLENKNEIFIPTDEPFGLISATLAREPAAQPSASAEMTTKR